MYIAVDFDGTCVVHKYPYVGKDLGAGPILKALSDKGHKIILYTMRNEMDDDGDTDITRAVNWMNERNIPLFGINHNPDQDDMTHLTMNKIYANIYIDDSALGVPLMRNPYDCDDLNPCVNWGKVLYILYIRYGLFTDQEYNELLKEYSDFIEPVREKAFQEYIVKNKEKEIN